MVLESDKQPEENKTVLNLVRPLMVLKELSGHLVEARSIIDLLVTAAGEAT